MWGWCASFHHVDENTRGRWSSKTVGPWVPRWSCGIRLAQPQAWTPPLPLYYHIRSRLLCSNHCFQILLLYWLSLYAIQTLNLQGLAYVPCPKLNILNLTTLLVHFMSPVFVYSWIQKPFQVFLVNSLTISVYSHSGEPFILDSYYPPSQLSLKSQTPQLALYILFDPSLSSEPNHTGFRCLLLSGRPSGLQFRSLQCCSITLLKTGSIRVFCFQKSKAFSLHEVAPSYLLHALHTHFIQ